MVNGIIFDWIRVLSTGSKGGVFPFSESVLQRLKPSYKLGLVTLAGFGNEKRIQDINGSGLRPFFDSIVVNTTKKSEHYFQCTNELNLIPQQTLLVDDRTVKGIKIGNELGCQTCWVMYDKCLHEAPNEFTGQPTYRIKTIRDIFEVLT